MTNPSGPRCVSHVTQVWIIVQIHESHLNPNLTKDYRNPRVDLFMVERTRGEFTLLMFHTPLG